MDKLKKLHIRKGSKHTNDVATNTAEETTIQQPAISSWSSEKEEVSINEHDKPLGQNSNI